MKEKILCHKNMCTYISEGAAMEIAAERLYLQLVTIPRVMPSNSPFIMTENESSLYVLIELKIVVLNM